MRHTTYATQMSPTASRHKSDEPTGPGGSAHSGALPQAREGAWDAQAFCQCVDTEADLRGAVQIASRPIRGYVSSRIGAAGELERFCSSGRFSGIVRSIPLRRFSKSACSSSIVSRKSSSGMLPSYMYSSFPTSPRHVRPVSGYGPEFWVIRKVVKMERKQGRPCRTPPNDPGLKRECGIRVIDSAGTRAGRAPRPRPWSGSTRTSSTGCGRPAVAGRSLSESGSGAVGQVWIPVTPRRGARPVPRWWGGRRSRRAGRMCRGGYGCGRPCGSPAGTGRPARRSRRRG